METFTELKELAENPYYQVQRQKSLCGLTDDMIDLPIIEVINGFNKLRCCFTLQSCYGHFVYNGKKDFYNLLRNCLESKGNMRTANKALYRTLIPLRSMAAGELGRYPSTMFLSKSILVCAVLNLSKDSISANTGAIWQGRNFLD